MEFMQEYGLAVAVALPVLVVVAINVLLALGGESGTLLLPSLKPYPTVYAPQQQVALAEDAAPAAGEPVVEPSRPVARPARPKVHVEGFEEERELLARQAA